MSFPQQPNAQNNGLFVCQTQSASKETSVWACNWHEGNYKRLAIALTRTLDCVCHTATLFLTSIGTLHKGPGWWLHWLPKAHFCGQISWIGTISRRKCTTWFPEWLKPRGLLPKWRVRLKFSWSWECADEKGLIQKPLKLRLWWVGWSDEPEFTSTGYGDVLIKHGELVSQPQF